MTTKSTVIIRDIPPDLKREFKIACAIADISQRDAMITLMREWVEKKGDFMALINKREATAIIPAPWESPPIYEEKK
jgi:hypothetical protein